MIQNKKIGGFISVASNTSNIIYLDKDYQATSDNPVYVKKTLKSNKRQYSYFIPKEIEAMSILEGTGISPKVVDSEEYWIIMTYGGQRVNINNIPIDWERQAENILEVLREKNISHNDIQCEELLIKDSRIHLIDFQHWTPGREVFNKLLKEGKIKHSVRENDRTAVFNCLKKIWGKRIKLMKDIL